VFVTSREVPRSKLPTDAAFHFLKASGGGGRAAKAAKLQRGVGSEESGQRTGEKYRLPTEAEWEFAARGGILNQGNKYSGSNTIDEVGWYKGNSGGKIQPGGRKKPNELGLFDMCGNVAEWCQDYYSVYDASQQNNPQGPNEGSSRVIRGGSWQQGVQECRNSSRNDDSPSIRYYYTGFRLAR
jgi:formylglycine-generating enzyme required for sulfatase activity